MTGRNADSSSGDKHSSGVELADSSLHSRGTSSLSWPEIHAHGESFRPRSLEQIGACAGARKLDGSRHLPRCARAVCEKEHRARAAQCDWICRVRIGLKICSGALHRLAGPGGDRLQDHAPAGSTSSSRLMR